VGADPEANKNTQATARQKPEASLGQMLD